MNNSATEQIFLLNPPTNQQSSHPKLIEIPAQSQGNLEDVEDFSSVCRTCASITQFVIPIFSGEGLQNNLAEKIHKHLPVQVSEQDELPQAVCYQCAHTLLAWHELVACCEQADKALRTRHRQMKASRNQDVKPARAEENQTTENREQNQFKPCQYLAEKATEPHATFETKDIEPQNHATNDNDNSDNEVASDDEDEPLSSLATKKSSELYNNFYKALVRFRDHFLQDHETESVHASVTDSSDSEMVPEEDIVQDDFDDLTQSNMRKDRMDEETRLELNEVRTKINGKVYYSCKICGKNLSSSHTYVFHKRIHTGERPCVCHVCGKQFRAPSGLQRHVTETHEKVRRHSCRYCPKNFANSQNLKQHMRIHTGERPFVCPHCGKRFTQSGSLHVHLKTHSELSPFQCAECGAKFRLRSGLSRHRLKHTGERPHICVHCGKGFRQKYELNSHSLSHTDSKPFNCVLCGAAFRQRRALTHHTKRLHEHDQNRDLSVTRGSNMLVYTQIGQYQFEEIVNFVVPAIEPPRYENRGPPLKNCTYCPSQHTQEDLKDHVVSMHSDLVFHCDNCDNYVDKRDFVFHMSLHAVEYAAETAKNEKEALKKKKMKKRREIKDENENTEQKPVPEIRKVVKFELPAEKLPERASGENCAENEFSDQSDNEYGFGPIPESVFEAIEDTQDSQRDEERPENEPRAEIDKTAPLRKKVGRNTKRSRACQVCGKVYTAASSYFYHMKYSHKISKDYKCPRCDRKFQSKTCLNQHMKTHSGRFEFSCKHCGKKFQTNASLYIHEQIHDGVKVFSCSQCQIAFRWRTHLARHMKRHATERSHVCTSCGRAFAVHCDLLRHVRTHSAGNYKCDQCGGKFAQQRYLKVHLLKKHSGQK